MRAKYIAVASLLLIVACNEAGNKEQTETSDRKIEQVDPIIDKAGFQTGDTIANPATANAEKKQKGTDNKVPGNPDWDKKIIKNATLNMEVVNYDDYYKVLREKVRSAGGYISAEEQSKSEYKIENTVVIKVPVDQFDNAISLLSTAEKNVKQRSITSQDVTNEYVDTRSRIEAKKQVRQRYMDLMNQAKNMQEILSVQSEINSIQEEIEAATGRVNYLGHAATLSTISLTFYQVLNKNAGVETEPSFWRKTGLAFMTGARCIADLFVALVTVWPLFICAGIAFVLMKKIRIKKPASS